MSRYHMLPEHAHTTPVQACLGFLLHLDAHIDTKLVENFPLAQCAAEFCFMHGQFQDVASHVKYGMRDLFDPHKLHFALWMGIHDADKDADDYHQPFYDSELDDSRLDDSGLSDSGVDDSERIRRTRTRFMLGVSQVL